MGFTNLALQGQTLTKATSKVSLNLSHSTYISPKSLPKSLPISLEPLGGENNILQCLYEHPYHLEPSLSRKQLKTEKEVKNRPEGPQVTVHLQTLATT